MRKDEDEADAGDVAQNRICSACVREPFLQSEVIRLGVGADCSYCDQTGTTVTIAELADYVDTAFQQHYERTSPEADGLEYLMIKEGGWWERHGEPVASVIGEAADIAEEPAEHVRLVLEDRHFDIDDARAGEENPFSSEAYYEEGGVKDYELQAGWRHFQESITTESRFFNPVAEGDAEINLRGP